MSIMPEPVKPFPPQHRVVLDWLCRQPASVHDFADVADAVKIKRGEMEQIFADLRHQRWGAPLALRGPDGIKLRPRHAYLPPDSPARKGYPAPPAAPIEHKEHPTITAMRIAVEEERVRKETEERVRLAEIAERGEVAAGYRQRKNEARAAAKVAADDAPKPERFVTGYSPPQPEVVKVAPKPAVSSAPAPEIPEPKLIKRPK